MAASSKKKNNRPKDAANPAAKDQPDAETSLDSEGTIQTKDNPNWNLFQKGRKKTGGRKKGTPDKITTIVKEALENTYEGLGGDAALKAFALDHPEEFFKLWIKMLPKQINADLSSNGKPLVSLVTSDQAEKMIRDLHDKMIT